MCANRIIGCHRDCTYALRNTPERADDCLPSSNEDDVWPREELRLPRDEQEEQLEGVEYGQVRGSGTLTDSYDLTGVE